MENGHISVIAKVRFAIGTFSLAGCPPFAGLVMDDRVIAVDAMRAVVQEEGFSLPVANSTLSLLECWNTALPALQAAANALHNAVTPAARTAQASMVPMSALKVHPPVAARQIFMCGANYFKHVVDIIVDMGPGKSPGTGGMSPVQLRAYAEELMRKRQRDGSPYVFTKPITTLSGAYDPIIIPSFAEQPDWELELAVVIAAPARHVRREQAMNYVAGYAIANDITNRDWIWARADMKAMGTDWLPSKCCPGFLPFGPYLVPATHVQDPMDLHMKLDLNGETKQDERTSDMIFDIARQIEYISSIVQLLPGDVICTGSPAGNGTHYKRFLQPGDVVDTSITGLGNQRNPVLSENS